MNRRLLVFKLQDSRYPFTSFIFRRKSFQCLFLYLCDRYTDIRLSLFVVRPLCALIKNNIIASYKRYDVSYQAITPCRNFNSVSRIAKDRWEIATSGTMRDPSVRPVSRIQTLRRKRGRGWTVDSVLFWRMIIRPGTNKTLVELD